MWLTAHATCGIRLKYQNKESVEADVIVYELFNTEISGFYLFDKNLVYATPN
jgi:hypothetical protein